MFGVANILNIGSTIRKNYDKKGPRRESTLDNAAIYKVLSYFINKKREGSVSLVIQLGRVLEKIWMK